MSRFSFDRFVLDATDRRLRANGCDVAVGARAIELLVALLEQRGSLLTKQDLLEKVWPGKSVGENNLATQVSALRNVLGAGAIVTVPGRGYRFGLSVSVQADSPPAIPPLETDAPAKAAMDIPPTFGNLQWWPDERRVTRDGRALDLGARAYDLLAVLIAERHRVVPKSELLRRAWSGLVVQEDNLFAQIANLRRTLGDEAIATVPGRGYRFVARLVGPGLNADPQRGAEAHFANGHSPDAPALRSEPPNSAEMLGRDRELRELTGLMSRCRLITVVGPGGIGKTTLAREVAREFMAANGIGVTWVDLSRLSDAALVTSAFARALNIPLGTNTGLAELVAALQLTQRVVVVDSAEHVLASVAEAAQALLVGAPGIRLLVTSQAALRVRDEQAVRLDALALPPGSVSFESARDFGAVSLFVERAHAADQRFELRASNVATVVDICRRLDGMPLAIELAAARQALFGLQGLARRLDERFQLLVGGSRMAPPRHKTLRAALDWSHDLLSAAEQRVFRRLGVFVGGFTLEMAVQVAGDPADDTWSVTEHLATLVDRSLVVSDGNLDKPRYRLLDTPRAYALAELQRAGELQATQRAHAEAVAAMCDGMHEAYILDQDDAYLQTYEPELENLRTAFAWTVEQQSDLGVGIAAAGVMLMVELGLISEASELVTVGSRLVSTQTTPLATARFLCNQCIVALVKPLDEVLAAVHRGIELMRDLNRPIERVYAVSNYAAYCDPRHLETATLLVEGSRRLVSDDWHPNLHYYQRWGETALSARRPAVDTSDLRDRLQECIRIARHGRNRRGSIVAVVNLAMLEFEAKRWPEAEAAAREAIEEASGPITRKFPVTGLLAAILMLTLVTSHIGRTDEARQLAGKALALSVGHTSRFYLVADPLAYLLAKVGKVGLGLRFLGFASAEGQRLGTSRLCSNEEEVLSIARSVMDEDEIAALLDRGAAMVKAEAVSLAIEFLHGDRDSALAFSR